MSELDLLDRRILFELDRNSRQPVSEIARTLRQGRDRVEYRIERLIERKIVRKFVVSVNIYKLGYTLYKIYFRLENRKERISEFIAHLRSHPRTYWIAWCYGGWDLTLVVFARDAHEFHELHSQILSQFNDVVLNFSAYTLVNFKTYSRDYLAKARGNHFVIGGKPQKLPLDDIDLRILRLLAKDSRTQAVKIGEQVGLTHQMVRARIDRLEHSGIISGYRIEINLEKIGMMLFKTQFYLRNYGLGLREQLVSYCDKNPRIVAYIEQVGDCNLEIEMEAGSYGEFEESIDLIRSEFSTLIRNFQSMLLRKTHRYPVPDDISAETLRSYPRP